MTLPWRAHGRAKRAFIPHAGGILLTQASLSLLRRMSAIAIVFLVVQVLVRATLAWRAGASSSTVRPTPFGRSCSGPGSTGRPRCCRSAVRALLVAAAEKLAGRPLRYRDVLRRVRGACLRIGFTAIGEHLFWTEFGARFNFIAIDYLVYTHEVIGNIRGVLSGSADVGRADRRRAADWPGCCGAHPAGARRAFDPGARARCRRRRWPAAAVTSFGDTFLARSGARMRSPTSSPPTAITPCCMPLGTTRSAMPAFIAPTGRGAGRPPHARHARRRQGADPQSGLSDITHDVVYPGRRRARTSSW